MPHKRTISTRSERRRRSTYDRTSRKPLLSFEDTDYILWILSGGGALTAIALSTFTALRALYLTEEGALPSYAIAISNTIILLTSGWYFTYHHDRANTFWDSKGNRILGKTLTSRLVLAFAAATGLRFILMDIGFSIDRGQFYIKPENYAFPFVLIVAWLFYYLVTRHRLRSNVETSFIDPSTLNTRAVTFKKLQNLSADELEEFAGLLYKDNLSRKAKFQDIINFLWKAIVMAFVIQLLQAIIGSL